MNDSESNIPVNPRDDDPYGDTQPRKRLRRLLAGSQENEAAMNEGAAGLSGSQPEGNRPAASSSDEATQAMRPSAEQPAGAGDTLPLPPSDSSQPLPSTPQVPPQDPSQSGRHPTGTPDSTGGWYGDLSATRPQAAGPDAPLQTGRHPTGQPDSTVGWYGAPPPSAADPGQTRPVQSGHTPPRGVPTGRPSRTPSSAPPPFSYDNQGLPRRVEENDPSATQVTPAAYQSHSSAQPTIARPAQSSEGYPPPPPTMPQRPYNAQGGPETYSRSVGVPPYGGAPASRAVPTGRRASGWRRGMGCILRGLIAMLFLVVFVVVAAGSWLVFQYFAIASELPPVDQLRQRASQFETTRIYDRNGTVLYEIIDPNAGKRTYVPLERISPNLIAATIATEDREFYNHPGFDPIAIARAFWQNYTSGEVVSGASTITQQLARMLLLSPEDRFTQSYERKAREIVLAAEITRNYSKDEILELYLNEANYSNLAYGIEAAAETYFNTTADRLTIAQASFLAGLPQSPAVYDVFTNRDATLRRQKQVVLLMLEASQLKGCIPVSNSPDPVCVDEAIALQAVQEIEAYEFRAPENNMRYPHWVTFIRSILEAQYQMEDIYRSGFNVYTTLDASLQDQAQAVISGQVQSMADRNAHNGALVAIRPSTGEILAMVGSPDFNDEQHAGQVNMAISPRQPGSSIKPLTYAAAFEKGWTPSTLIWDVPTDFPPSGDPNDTRPPYQPVNYDGRFHGPVSVRSALANSYNIPAVKALQFVGIYGDSGLISFAKRLGINSLDRPDYGLSLTLGGGEVSLLDMTSAFSTFANNGKRMPPIAITKITDFRGNVVYEYKVAVGEQVVRPEHAYLITSILSDNEARTPMFGASSVLNLPFQAAAKTGTTNDFRDNWTIGYNPDLAVGVWIGNADYTEMQNVTGLTGAAPAWSTFMQYAVPLLTNGNPTPFQRPNGIVEKVVCAVSGTEPSEFCSQQRTEIFAHDQQPKPKDDDLWKRVNIDTWTGLRASPECSDFAEEKLTLNVEDPAAVRWIKDTEDGRNWAASVGFAWPITFLPERECKLSDPRPKIHFAGFGEGETITRNPLDVYAVVNATSGFKQYRLEWGQGDDPVEWHTLVENSASPHDNPERIHTWELSEIPAGRVTLRIYLENIDADLFAERRIHLNLQVPTPTPTLTPTVTATPTPTNTQPATNTPAPTNTQPPPPPADTEEPAPVETGGAP